MRGQGRRERMQNAKRGCCWRPRWGSVTLPHLYGAKVHCRTLQLCTWPLLAASCGAHYYPSISLPALHSGSVSQGCYTGPRYYLYHQQQWQLSFIIPDPKQFSFLSGFVVLFLVLGTVLNLFNFGSCHFFGFVILFALYLF